MYSGLQQVTTVTEWLQWVAARNHSRLPSGYSGLQNVTASYRDVTVGYSRLQQVTEWLQRVTAG